MNPLIVALEPAKVPPVKFQEIVRDGQATIVARMKIPTPSGHAFILRRLDTGAISLTTMFRTAFPTAPEDVERKEAAWVKATYDTSGANKSGKARFAGTWVNPDVALEIAKDYNLEPVIVPLADASPDPNMVYRKSQKLLQQQPTPVASPVAHTGAAARDAAPPAKRRRDASPTASATLVNPSAETGATPARRSTRQRSPATVTPAAKTPKTPKTIKAVHEHLVSIHTNSDETAVEEEDMEIVKVAQPNVEEDVREQKELVERLKADRSAAEASQMLAVEGSTQSVAPKREREDEKVEYKLDIKEPETEERAVVSNSRVRVQMPPERKSLAWGALLFAAGLGAVTFLPSLPGLF
ncbi:uncharacterized protein PHACADRAFT_252627 [Phanerochaete carnosa HHB-10118-sp]|uniref:HTH APSES-type domain-containing protein n=1 Tax=Phanerochaete carnosa (strain HHB-10118-sp) TaxID=650164 RepID=K5V6N5_PHACS|nr:uncharacterized protein PHACADRAFT_252627 [Phanerochaete carnosa HHB-10118-sp]EKM58366.1 hypothetical protein PHACADRAFT_252627 [Phanerochaete carnosa HHB-10118-sp]